MLKLKASVDARNMTATLMLGVAVVHSVYEALGLDLVITSIRDGRHMPRSLHYAGQAFDCRLPAGIPLADLVRRLREALGPQYDVVPEETHIHVEFDPD